MKKTVVKLLLLGTIFISAASEITPYKFTDDEMGNGGPEYVVPSSAKNYVSTSRKDNPEILFYYNQPKVEEFPIIFFCTGSSQKDTLYSVIHVHRYFLQESLDINCGLITIEQQGMDDQSINKEKFWNNYTRSNRLKDHEKVIEYLFANPPQGWNKKLIFIGCSEGGPLVEQLTEKYSFCTQATISWSGAGDWSWRDELWIYLKPFLPLERPSVSDGCLKDHKDYDELMNKIIKEKGFEKEFVGMTYAYHADALSWPEINYSKLKTPFLVVSGALDDFIPSSDDFVKKAVKANVDVTYYRIEDMDHFIRKRPEIIEESFEWLQKIIEDEQK